LTMLKMAVLASMPAANVNTAALRLAPAATRGPHPARPAANRRRTSGHERGGKPHATPRSC
jgi:hypothetical protein